MPTAGGRAPMRIVVRKVQSTLGDGSGSIIPPKTPVREPTQMASSGLLPTSVAVHKCGDGRTGSSARRRGNQRSTSALTRLKPLSEDRLKELLPSPGGAERRPLLPENGYRQSLFGWECGDRFGGRAVAADRSRWRTTSIRACWTIGAEN